MNPNDFLSSITRRERGKLKLYIGSAAGVGKSYRMLNEAHDLRRRGADVVIGFIETHGRVETEAQLRDLEVVPRQKVEYRGVVLEDMDLAAILRRRPQIVIVDELAHTNVPGVQNRKRWEDVIALLDAGINVIAAVNVQHIESLNNVIATTLGVTVRETVPDWIVASAEEVVSIDISAEDLRQRLREGKIYRADKIETSLRNFFTDENLTTLRELALREVASSVDRSREAIVQRENGEKPVVQSGTVDRVMVAMSSNPPYTAALLRKASRIAGRLNTDWYCVYVQTPNESADRIDSTLQRTLVSNIQLAQSMGAEIVKLVGEDVAQSLADFAHERRVSLMILGVSRATRLQGLFRRSVVDRIVESARTFDVLVAASDGQSHMSKTSGGALQNRPKEQAASSRTSPAESGESRVRLRTGDAAKRPSQSRFIRDTALNARLLRDVANSAQHRLNEIQLPLHILLDNHFGELNENQEEVLASARAAADGIGNDFECLSDLAKIELGELPLRADRVFPADLLHSIMPSVVALAEDVGVHVRFEIAPLLPQFPGDQVRLQGALLEILRQHLRGMSPQTEFVVNLQRHDAHSVLVLTPFADSPESVQAVCARAVLEHSGFVFSAESGELRLRLPQGVLS